MGVCVVVLVFRLFIVEEFKLKYTRKLSIHKSVKKKAMTGPAAFFLKVFDFFFVIRDRV